jgi:hypothetical protein
MSIPNLPEPRFRVVAGLLALGLFMTSCLSKPLFDNPYDPEGVGPVVGRDWVQATASAGFSPRYLHVGMVFNERIWVFGGYQ